MQLERNKLGLSLEAHPRDPADGATTWTVFRSSCVELTTFDRSPSSSPTLDKQHGLFRVPNPTAVAKRIKTARLPALRRLVSMMKAIVLIAATLSEHWTCVGVVASTPVAVNIEITQSEFVYGARRYTILRNDERAVVATWDTYDAITVILLDPGSGILVTATSKGELRHASSPSGLRVARQVLQSGSAR
jgi:hypothetical protein